MLSDLENSQYYEIIKEKLNFINFNGIEHSVINVYIGVVVREITKKLLDAIYTIDKNNLDKKISYLAYIHETILTTVDVDDIRSELETFCSLYVPISKKHLLNIDYEVELLNLFCYNYLHKIHNQFLYKLN